MMLLQEKTDHEAGQEASVDEILDWLQAEMDARGLAGRIARDHVRERQESVYRFVLVPLFLSDTDDVHKVRVNLERSWNEREPRPKKLLFLYPGGAPDGVV